MSTLLVLNKVRVFLSDIFGSEIHFLCYERVVEKLCQKLVQTVCRLCYLQQELYSSKWTSAQQYQRDSTRTSWRKLWTDSRSIGHYRKNTRLRVNVNILRRWRLLIRWTADVQAASTWSPATTVTGQHLTVSSQSRNTTLCFQVTHILHLSILVNSCNFCFQSFWLYVNKNCSKTSCSRLVSFWCESRTSCLTWCRSYRSTEKFHCRYFRSQ